MASYLELQSSSVWNHTLFFDVRIHLLSKPHNHPGRVGTWSHTASRREEAEHGRSWLSKDSSPEFMAKCANFWLSTYTWPWHFIIFRTYL